MLISIRIRRHIHEWSAAVISGMMVLGITLSGYAEEGAKDCPLTDMVLVAAADEKEQPADSGTVEERAVPRMNPGLQQMPALKGGLVEGNRLRALPGYALDVRPDGGGFMLRPAGGGKGPTGRCSCSLGGGSCSVKRDGNDGVKCVSKGCDACGIIIDNAAIGGGLRSIQ